jgi:hypothetical protein
MGFSWIMLGREPRSNKEPLMNGSTEAYSLGDGRHAPTLAQGRKPSLRAAVDARYGDIHFIAVRQLHRERHLSIPPTVLVHEAYFRLFEFAPNTIGPSH